MSKIAIEECLHRREGARLIDVRSPIEFEEGHVPLAVNLPLFEDSERAEVGRLYRSEGKEAALLLGLDIVGPKMRLLVEQGKKLAQNRELILMCSRGGMRSSSVAWLFTQAGIPVRVVSGGYKAFLRWRERLLQRSLRLVMVYGKTGVGKTDLLKELSRCGEQVIDLEALAHHKGSAFGGVGENPQPSSAQFANVLASTLSALNPQQKIWVEGESRMIGRCVIPLSFWRQMQTAPRVLLRRSREDRVARLCKDYQMASDEELAQALNNISKRLGAERTQQALKALSREDRDQVAAICLLYYDHQYERSEKKRQGEALATIKLDTQSELEAVEILKNLKVSWSSAE